jgi:hypothetical protein
MTKQSNLKCRTGDVVKAHIHPELVFRRALALANVREEVSVEKVLAYPVGPIPTAIFMQTCRDVNKIFRACFNIEWVSHVVLDIVY